MIKMKNQSEMRNILLMLVLIYLDLLRNNFG